MYIESINIRNSRTFRETQIELCHKEREEVKA